MEHLKIIKNEIDYILEIYDDIKNTYDNLPSNINISSVYNNDDLNRFLIIIETCRRLKFNSDNSLDFAKLVNKFYDIHNEYLNNKIDYDLQFKNLYYLIRLKYETDYKSSLEYVKNSLGILINKYIDFI